MGFPVARSRSDEPFDVAAHRIMKITSGIVKFHPRWGRELTVSLDRGSADSVSEKPSEKI